MDSATPTPRPTLAGADAVLGRAHALFLQRRDAQALPLARTAVDALPLRADARTLLGILQARLGHTDAAEATYREAIRMQPGYADAWTNLGNLLRDRDDRHGALVAFQQALRQAPHSPDPPYNLGVALERFGLWDGALGAFQAAIECDPRHVDAHWNSALGLLHAGRFAEGFREYEWRFRRDEAASRTCPRPVWDGRPLEGRTILVWAEQGFGGTLQFLRFVPAVARLGGRVVLEVMDGLQGLAVRPPGVCQVVVRGEPMAAFDTHVALMSLPHVLGLAPAHSPAPYLRAQDALVSQWRERLDAPSRMAKRELTFGLVWAGNPTLRNGRESSPGFAVGRPLLDVPGTRCISLQIGEGCHDLVNAAPPRHFVDLQHEIADFDDTAAIIANLDVVVTCDTAVTHLAGALGKPTFVMLPHAPDWRHGLDPDTSPWYPSMRLFRQSTAGEWTGVLARAAEALVATVATLPSRDLASAHAAGT